MLDRASMRRKASRQSLFSFPFILIEKKKTITINNYYRPKNYSRTFIDSRENFDRLNQISN